MAVFTSTYRTTVAHGDLNWDTPLRNDFTALEAFINQGLYTGVAWGGSGASIGSGGTVNCYATRLGSQIAYHGQIAFGGGGAFGGAIITGLNQYGSLDPAYSWGEAWWHPVSGYANVRPLHVLPSGIASQFNVQIPDVSGSSALSTLGTPVSGDQIHFRLFGVLNPS